MNALVSRIPIEGAIVLFCMTQNSALWTAWLHSPLDRMGGPSFLLWSVPTVVALTRRFRTAAETSVPPLAIVALMVIGVGRLVDLNALLAWGLALACAAAVPGGPRRILWLTCAIAWMPGLGWLTSRFPSEAIASLRLVLGAGSIFLQFCPRGLVRFA